MCCKDARILNLKKIMLKIPIYKLSKTHWWPKHWTSNFLQFGTHQKNRYRAIVKNLSMGEFVLPYPSFSRNKQKNSPKWWFLPLTCWFLAATLDFTTFSTCPFYMGLHLYLTARLQNLFHYSKKDSITKNETNTEFKSSTSWVLWPLSQASTSIIWCIWTDHKAHA